MIHPINIEADLLSANPSRPQLIIPRPKPKITYGSDGRRFKNGKPTTPTSPQSLWNRCFLRSFTHRLASAANEEMQETQSIDSFIDVVDLKPEEASHELADNFNQKFQIDNNNNKNLQSSITKKYSSSDEDEILPETFIQGPKASSLQEPQGIQRRRSHKIEREHIRPLIEACCTDIRENFKEFLRFDFSNTQLLKNVSDETHLKPDSHGKRIWTRDTEKPRTPLANALCFKISSVVAMADKLTIKVNMSNPSDHPVSLEIVTHVHLANDSKAEQRLYQCLETVALPSDCPLGVPLEFQIPMNGQIKEIVNGKDAEKYLLVTMMGRVLPSGAK